MGLFDKHLGEIRAYIEQKRLLGKVSQMTHAGPVSWPIDKNRNLVMGQDTAVELGNPKDASFSLLFWTDDPTLLNNRTITLVGPDVSQSRHRQLSFGKVVIAGGEGFSAENSFDRYREMELLRYDLHLKGYMMRAASQYSREWSRISHEAIDNGFSLKTLGGALIERLLQLDYIRAAEVMFITSDRADVLEMQAIAKDITDIISAMNKMAENLSFDCDECEYNEVCADVGELRAMHAAMKAKAANA